MVDTTGRLEVAVVSDATLVGVQKAKLIADLEYYLSGRDFWEKQVEAIKARYIKLKENAGKRSKPWEG